MSPNVYIFDTDPGYLTLLKGICRTSNLHAFVFNNSSEFLQQLPQQSIVVLDIKMSFCEGQEILKKLSHTQLKLKFILISSYDTSVLKEAKRMAQNNRLCVAACLRKPILVSSFRGALEQAVTSIQQTSLGALQEVQVS